ncbi:MAG: hypothetical protein M1831_003520 [Alyxoria varia]|nr:MAG: hypothetical protein M1831_003520 [Alyxoria varia]
MASLTAQRLLLTRDEKETRSFNQSSFLRFRHRQKTGTSVSNGGGQLRSQEKPATSAVSNAIQKTQTVLSRTKCHLYTLWLFLESDFATFVLPNTAFGMFGALSGLLTNTVPTVSITSTPTSLLSPSTPPSPPPLASSSASASTTPPVTSTTILLALLKLLTFNTLNLLIFDLANQRLPSSIREDAHNKPWRPLPTRRLTPRAAQRLLLAAVPTALLTCAFVLRGAVAETALLVALTWMYNDLGGGDRGYVVRNGIIAVAFGGYNLGSLRLAAGTVGAPSLPGHAATTTATAGTTDTGSSSSSSFTEQPGPIPQAHDTTLVNPTGLSWTCLVSLIIFATMHVQDLKDQAGDSARGRRTMPLVLGDGVARWSIAAGTAVAAVGCPVWFWGVDIISVGSITGVGRWWRSMIGMGWWVSTGGMDDGFAFGGLVGVAGCVGLGMVVAGRVLLVRDKGRGDKKTWKLWCAWCAWLYLLPVLRVGVGGWW